MLINRWQVSFSAACFLISRSYQASSSSKPRNSWYWRPNNSRKRHGRPFSVLQQRYQRVAEAVLAFRHDQAMLGTQRPGPVDQPSLVRHQSLTQAMQALVQLLLDAFDCNGSDAPVLGRLGNGFGVVVIILLATQVALDVLRWQQLDHMPQRLHLPGPVMGTRAGLHGNHRFGIVRQKRQKLAATELLASSLFAPLVQYHNEEHSLCQIDTDCRRFVHGLLLSLLVSQ